MPPCLTSFETVKKQDVDWPHLMHISWLLYQRINILTINNGTLRIISLLASTDVHRCTDVQDVQDVQMC